jgi:hypothetical protein
MDWPERYSAALELDLTAEEIDTILDLARDVAHATERRFAPLSTYLTGRYVTRRQTEGATVDEALREARATVNTLLT